ncbi:MAG: hypothetical protein DMG15_21860 [Acidobacteria bacterium]|nr:MAG: hypothetical protein DMG15_21860 [Acidobacteriota bacterium]
MPTAIRLNLFKAGRPKRAKERTAKMIGKRPAENFSSLPRPAQVRLRDLRIVVGATCVAGQP